MISKFRPIGNILRGTKGTDWNNRLGVGAIDSIAEHCLNRTRRQAPVVSVNVTYHRSPAAWTARAVATNVKAGSEFYCVEAGPILVLRISPLVPLLTTTQPAH